MLPRACEAHPGVCAIAWEVVRMLIFSKHYTVLGIVGILASCLRLSGAADEARCQQQPSAACTCYA
jgi:hypothetical protein